MIPILLSLALATAPWPALATPTAPQDREAALRRPLDAWVAVWNSFDLDGVDRLFVADASVTYFSSERNGLIQGIEALREHHHGFGFRPGGAAAGSRLWLEDVEVRWEGETAVVLAQWLFARAGSEGPPQKGPVTFVFVARDGEYRILHAHFANGVAGG
ncbi:MAG: nuclear transport factor 2 family protein [Longimicrobiales bacterium]|nr:nuclear transport factor 2 family protein [Longimicrobiales bacterium]